jgi:hypothetical protein
MADPKKEDDVLLQKAEDEPSRAEETSSGPSPFAVFSEFAAEHLAFVGTAWRSVTTATQLALIVSVVAFVSAALYAAALSEVDVDYERQKHAGVMHAMAVRLLAAQDAVLTEQLLSQAYTAEVWLAATAAEAAAFAPAAATTAAAIAASDAYLAVFAATDAAVNDVAVYFADNFKDLKDTIYNSQIMPRGATVAELQHRIGVRATRAAALTADTERITALQTHEFDSTAPMWSPVDASVDDQLLTFFGFLGPSQLTEIRNGVTPTMTRTAEMNAESYRAVQRKLLRLAVVLVSEPANDMHHAALAVFAGVAAKYTQQTHALAARLADTAAVAALSDGALAALVAQYASATAAAKLVTAELVLPLLDTDTLVQYALRVSEGSEGNATATFQQHLEGAVLAPTAAVTFTAAQAAAAPAQTAALQAAATLAVAQSDAAATDSFLGTVAFGVALSLAVLLGTAACLRYTVKSQNEVAEEQKRNAVMKQVIVRVQELAKNIRLFTLDACEAPLCMRGTEVASVENILQRCIASLKFIAPLLPPLMFPARSVAAALHFSQFHRSMADVTKNEALNPEQAQALFETAVEGEVDTLCDEAVARLASTKQSVKFAAFLYLDMADLHAFEGSTDAMKVSEEFYPMVIGVFEQQVVLHGGVMLAAVADHVAASWDLPEPLPGQTNPCESAARTAQALAAVLSQFKAKHPVLEGKFTVRLAVTAGNVTFGAFGGQLMTIQVFGTCVEMASEVCRANKPHDTTVTMDDTVRLAVEHLMPCKPIEILSDGSRAHELLLIAAQQKTDLVTQLAEYKKAFYLYENKFYAKSLKAFRKYTKQYGYDSSVERIQFLTTGI